MVLTRVDLPRPVCPARIESQSRVTEYGRIQPSLKKVNHDEHIHTNTHDIELEATLQQLPLDLGSNAVETDMAVGEDGGLLSRSSSSSGGHYQGMCRE